MKHLPIAETPNRQTKAGWIAEPTRDSSSEATQKHHRIDAPHRASAAPTPAVTPDAARSVSKAFDSGGEFDFTGLRLTHCEDLASRLQTWAEDLDARSSKLAADIAKHDRRERAFRLWVQESRASIERQLEANEKLHQTLLLQARRFAVKQPESNSHHSS